MVVVMTMVYCTKRLVNGNRRLYGPYGPYYYEYWWDWDPGQARMETKSRYIGKTLPADFTW